MNAVAGMLLGVTVCFLTLPAPSLRAQEEEPALVQAPPAANSEQVTPEQPANPAPPLAQEPADDELDPGNDMDPSPPALDPAQVLERFHQGHHSRAPLGGAPALQSNPAPPAQSAPLGGQVLSLTLKGGEVVNGEVLLETPLGWTLRLANGERRFIDKLDVPEGTVPGPLRIPLLHKALLLLSLLWPGGGQLLYGSVAFHGPLWERGALWAGALLGALSLLGLGILGAGILGGSAAPQNTKVIQLFLGGPVNPVSGAGALLVVMALGVGLLDAGARALLD